MKKCKKRILFFLGMLIIGAVGIVVYLSFTGNTSQAFSDIINEYTSMHASNKSAERALFYLFSFMGTVIYSIYYFISQKKNFISDLHTSVERKDDKQHLYVVIGLVVLTAVYYFTYSEVNWLLIAGLLSSIIFYEIEKTLIISGITYFFISSYAVCALYRLYVFAGGQKSLSMITVVLVVSISIIFILIMGRQNRKQFFLRGILVAQLIVPFTLLTYMASKYKYNGEYISINIPFRIKLLIGILITFFVIEAILKLRNKWKSSIHLGEYITYGVCIAIMSFNRYSGSGSVITTDLHHPFENIIGYSQIFELGQKPFSEYIPVSGMYSVLHGFFFSFFGNGEVSFYYLATNLFFLFAIISIVVLLKRQIKGEWLLLISIIFLVDDYNRYTFIVPVMLLLICPKLIERKNLWLKVWFLSSFLHGLYYPVFGAAVCIGFLPLGIWQIVTYIKTGELKKDAKRFSFWVWWIVCCIPVGFGSGLLIGTVKHMKAMGGQTIYADGITRFGQTIPDNFFSYIQLLPVRLIVYYLFSFLIVISLVWLSVALCLKNGNIRMEEKRIKIDNPVPAFISLSFGIALLVSFSYTVIRMDINSIYARSAGVVYAAVVMIIVIISKYMEGKSNRFWIFGFAMFIVAAVSAEGFFSMESDSKLTAYYTVPENYVYVIDDQVERLGECFVEEGLYQSIEDTYDYTANMDANDSYLGVARNFGHFYLCNIKGDSVMEAATIKGYGAAKETIDLIRDNNTIVGSTVYPINNYYLYHWLVTSGEYIWNPKNRVFEPNDGAITLNEILAQNKYNDLAVDAASLGKTAGSWGNSMDTLKAIFSEVNVQYNIENVDMSSKVNFDQAISGEDADFLYLEFADQDQNFEYTLFNLEENIVQDIDEYWYVKSLMKKDYNRDLIAIITWTDESGTPHSINCRMEKGKLLIPLGCGTGWLLNSHSDINIWVKQGEEIIAAPEISKIEMLKLREVE